MRIHSLFDPATFTLTYVVYDPQSRDAVVIDPVLDFDPLSAQTSLASIEKVAAFIDEQRLTLRFVLETHAHADHLTGAQYLKRRYGVGIVIGARIVEVQRAFKPIFDLPVSFATDGSQFDRLLADGDGLLAGTLGIEAIATPGHTPACLTYKLGDALFTGDALFIEDYGTGRCDFPRGSAKDLYHSVHERLYRQPDATRVFVGHDYQPGGRPVRFETTIGTSKQKNIQLSAATSEAAFIDFRTQRDRTLTQPRLLFPSVQVNVDAGRLPSPHENGIRYLRIPINLKQPTADDGGPLSQTTRQG
jgi:glyoxylase-like metal-dependent hydrolase (beta-lactamase superfamily II)